MVMALWYGLATAAITINPWLTVFLTDAGFSDAEAARAVMWMPLGGLLAGPAWAALADRWSPRGVLVVASSSAAAAAMVLLLAPPAWLVVCVAAVAITRAPMFPLVDAGALKALGTRYGQVRAVGSATFMITILVGGQLREVIPSGPIVVAVALLALSATLSGSVPVALSAPKQGSFRQLYRDRLLLGLAVVSVLHGTSLAGYDRLFALHVERLGHGPGVTGIAMGVAVLAEVLVFLAAPRILGRGWDKALLTVAVLSGVPRFLITALVTDPMAIAAAQVLHGLGFGLFWATAAHLVAKNAPDGSRNLAQAALPALAFGAGPLLALAGASVLLEHAGTPEVYTVLAGVSAVATAATLTLPSRLGAHGGGSQ